MDEMFRVWEEDDLPHIEDTLRSECLEFGEDTEMDMQELLERLVALEERVSELEYKLQRQEDERGYAEQGPRYSGKHPSSCACDRCLQKRFGNWK